MSMVPITGLPGPGSVRTATPRRVSGALGGLLKPGGIIINGSLSRDPLNTGDLDKLRAGLIMGKITATGLYCPAIIGTLKTAHTGDSTTSMTVDAATAVEINRIATSGVFQITGPPTANGTVAAVSISYSAVNTTTGVITITAESTYFVAGSFIGGVHATASDGSEEPRLILADGYPIKVTDVDANSVNVETGQVYAGGYIDSSQIINWPSDTSLQAWLMAKLNSGGLAADTAGAQQGPFIFDHVY